MKILVVCSGNICRSPMAAAVLRDRLDRQGRTGVAVASAGTLEIVGEPADPLAVSVAAEAGYDLGDHRSAALTAAGVARADLVLVMEERHASRAAQLGASASSIRLLGSFHPAGRQGGGAEEIADPVGGSAEDFSRCLATIEAAVDGLMEHWPAPDAEAPPADPEQRYFAEITERILGARGGGAGLSSLEFHLVDGWWKRGLPLWLVLEAAAEAALDWPPGEAPRSYIRSLAREVDERAAEAGMAVQDAAVRETPVDAPGGLRRLLLDELRAAGRRLGKAHPRLHEELKNAERALRTAPGHGPGLEAGIRQCRGGLIEAARLSLPLGERARIEAEERARLSTLGGRLTPGAEAETLKRLVEDRVLAYFHLPSLRAFDIASSS